MPALTGLPLRDRGSNERLGLRKPLRCEQLSDDPPNEPRVVLDVAPSQATGFGGHAKEPLQPGTNPSKSLLPFRAITAIGDIDV